MASEKPSRRTLVVQLFLWLMVASVGVFILVVIQRAWLDVPYGVAEGTRPAGLPGLAAPGSLIWWLIDLLAIIGTALSILTVFALTAPARVAEEGALADAFVDYAVLPPHSPFRESGRLQGRYLVVAPGAVSPLLARLPNESVLYECLPSGRYAAQLYRVLFVAQPRRSCFQTIRRIFEHEPPHAMGGGEGSLEIVESIDPPGRWCWLGRFPFYIGLPQPVRASSLKPWSARAATTEAAEDLARRRAASSGQAVMVREPITSVSLF